MKTYEIEVLSAKQVEALSGELKHNDYICETAGFEPLEVRFKRFEQQGLLMQVQRAELTSADYRNMYLNPDFDVSIDDDPEEIIEKMNALNDYVVNYKKDIATKNQKPTELAPKAPAPAEDTAEDVSEES